MPPNQAGRPPVTSRKDGPNTCNTSALRIAPARPADTRYHVTDLPPRIAANVTIDAESGCWVVGPGNGVTIDRDGYARLSGQGVHRIVYRALVGPIPADRPVLDHVKAWGCVSRACCRPDHLQACTIWQNTIRGESFAAVNYLKDECDHGHPFDLINVYWRPNGHRDCRRCIRRRAREYHQRVRAGQPVTRREAERAA